MPKITEEVYYIPGQDEFMPDSHVYVVGNPSSQNLSLMGVTRFSPSRKQASKYQPSKGLS